MVMEVRIFSFVQSLVEMNWEQDSIAGVKGRQIEAFIFGFVFLCVLCFLQLVSRLYASPFIVI